MKKIYLYVIAGVLAIAGCAKTPSVQEQIIPEDEPIATEPEEEADPEANVVTIKATIEGETKTTYTENTETMKAIVGWEAGDQIKVLYSNGEGGGYSIKDFTSTAGDGTFTGSPGDKTEGGAYAHVAFYPIESYASIWKGDGKESFYFNFPDEITGSGANMIPMMVYTLNADFESDPVYRFKHTGAVLRFKFTNIPSTARQLIITSASHELAGRYYTSYDSTNQLYYYTSGTSEDNESVGAKYSITYNFTPEVDNSYTFYLHHGLTTPSGDFTFTFKNAGGDVICSRTTTLGGLASTTLVRNTMYRVNIDAMSFDGYPLSSIIIGPTNVPNVPSGESAFTVGGFNFYGIRVENYGGLGNDIKFYQNGDSKDARIYNTSDFGRIAKIVISKGVTNYYYSSYIMYAGSSENPTSTEIPVASHDETTTTYNLATGDYHFFNYRINSTSSNQYFGTIQIYYKPND